MPIPFTPIPPPPTPVLTGDTKRDEQTTTLFQMNVILAQAGGFESNVAVPGEYWALSNKYRSLIRTP